MEPSAESDAGAFRDVITRSEGQIKTAFFVPPPTIGKGFLHTRACADLRKWGIVSRCTCPTTPEVIKEDSREQND